VTIPSKLDSLQPLENTENRIESQSLSLDVSFELFVAHFKDRAYDGAEVCHTLSEFIQNGVESIADE
jgi:hypothetical protein